MQSPEIDKLVSKIHLVQGAHGVVIGKDSKSNRNTYATLPGIISQIHSMIEPYGLVLTQGCTIVSGQNAMLTLLEDKESGQWRGCWSILTPKTIQVLPEYIVARMDQKQWESYCRELINQDPNHQWGGSSTYHRRYGAMMILGVFAVDDPTDFNEGKKEIISESSEQSHPARAIFGASEDTITEAKSPFISEKQQGLLRMKLNGSKEIADKILGRWNLTKLSDIPWRNFQDVLAFIEENK